MEGETPWEGQGFTLVIFACMVGLCSVFFILGMVVGRSQASRADERVDVVEAVDEPSALSPEPVDPDLTFYETVAEIEPPGLEPAGPEPAATGDAGPEAPPASSDAVMLQAGAFGAVEPAEALRQELEARGYPAFVLRPGPDDADSLNRVRVGPFDDGAEAERVRAALEAEGFDPIVVQ